MNRWWWGLLYAGTFIYASDLSARTTSVDGPAAAFAPVAPRIVSRFRPALHGGTANLATWSMQRSCKCEHGLNPKRVRACFRRVDGRVSFNL